MMSKHRRCLPGRGGRKAGAALLLLLVLMCAFFARRGGDPSPAVPVGTERAGSGDTDPLRGAPPRLQSEMLDFTQRIYDDAGAKVAVLSGRRAVLMDDGTYYLDHASVEMPLMYADGDEMLFDYGELASRRAELHRSSGDVALREDVRGRLMGWEVATDEAVFHTRSGRITAQGRVRAGVLSVAGLRWPGDEMVSGYGLEWDLHARRLTLQHSNTAELGLSGRDDVPAGSVPWMDMQVTSSGAFVHDHASGALSWQEAVRMEAGGLSLTCDRLTMERLWDGTGPAAHRMLYSATGNVTAFWDGYTLRGETLESAHGGDAVVLAGDPSVAASGGMYLLSRRMHVVRHSRVIETLLPGRMLFLPGRPRSGAFGFVDRAGDAAGCETIDWRRAAVEVDWNGRMHHDMDSLVSVLQGGVTLRQGPARVEGERLTVVLNRDGRSVRRAELEGRVRGTGVSGHEDRAADAPGAQRVVWHADGRMRIDDVLH